MSTDEVKAKTPRRKRRTAARRRRVLLLVVFIAAIAGWYFFSGPGAGKVLPSLVGMTQSQGQSAVESLGATLKVESSNFDEQVPADRILSSSPSAGKRIKAGSVVSVVVSKGPERYTVPDLAGKSVNDADSALAELGLLLGTRTDAFSDSIPTGMIISSTPAAGTQVRRGTNIDIVVSKGADLVALPSYIGLSADQAMSELGDAGFRPTQELAYSDKVAAGNVISQTPAAGNVQRGTVVALVVSQGPEFVTVPKVTGKKVSDAARILEDLGLKYTTNKVSGTVTSQTPKAGTKVKRGTVIKLNV